MYKHSEEENISHCFTSLHFRHYFLEKSCSQKSSSTSIQLQHTIGPTSFAKNKSKVARDSGYTLGWRRQFFVALRFHQAWRMQTFLQPFHLENMHSVHVDYYLGQAYYCKIEQHRVLLTLLSPPGLTLESLFSSLLQSISRMIQRHCARLGGIICGRSTRVDCAGAVSFARRAWKRLMWDMQGLCGTGIPSLCLHAPHAQADRTVRSLLVGQGVQAAWPIHQSTMQGCYWESPVFSGFSDVPESFAALVDKPRHNDWWVAACSS